MVTILKQQDRLARLFVIVGSVVLLCLVALILVASNASVTLDKLEAGTEAGQIVVTGDAPDFRPAYVAMSGDVSIDAAGTTTIAAGAITTDKIASAAVTKTKIGYKVVAVSVAAGAASGTSIADPDLVGGQIVGIYPTGNQDQFVDNVVLNSDGSVTVTLAGNAVAGNNFNVVVLKP